MLNEILSMKEPTYELAAEMQDPAVQDRTTAACRVQETLRSSEMCIAQSRGDYYVCCHRWITMQWYKEKPKHVYDTVGQFKECQRYLPIRREVVEEMKMEQRRKLLFFSTSLAHLPAEGFSGLSSKFHIHRAYTDLSWLPTAHTCFYQLVIPPYSCFEMMHDRLHAITEGGIAEGFGFP